MITWYFLDPNNNRKDPNNTIWFCARCKHTVKEKKETGYQSIILHPINPWFRIAKPLEKSDGFIGDDCLKKVIDSFGEM